MQYSDALELRTELEEWWRSDGGQHFSRGWSEARGKETLGGRAMTPLVGDIEIGKLATAAPFFVTNEMVDLLEASSKTFPATEFRREDLPVDSGFVLLARPLSFIDVHGKEYSFSAFSWGLAADPHNIDVWGVHLALYIHAAHDPERERLYRDGRTFTKFATLGLLHETPWSFGRDFNDPNQWTVRMDGVTPPPEALTSGLETMRAIHAFFILCWQKIAAPRETLADRAVRRRTQRFMPDRPVPLIRVVTLRRYREPREGDEPVGSSRTYSHQWIVNGFWRNHWYPSENRHKPLWIAPHVKGPKDKPLQVKDSVFVWRR